MSKYIIIRTNKKNGKVKLCYTEEPQKYTLSKFAAEDSAAGMSRSYGEKYHYQVVEIA